MEFEGTFRIRSPRDRVFAFFLNPEELSGCIDEPHAIEAAAPDRFRGHLTAGIGVIRGTFTWTASIAEKRQPERARIRIHGSGMHSAFDIEALVEMMESGGATDVSWHADVTMSGRLASMGARLMRRTIDRKTTSFFESAKFRLEGD